MHNKQSIYRTTFTSCIVLIAMLACCVALIGCPETTEMVDDVVLPPVGDPNVDPNTDPNADPNVDPNTDPNADPNVDPN